MKRYKAFNYLPFLSIAFAVLCDHPDPLCTNGLPCGPIQNYVGSQYFMACNGNDECDCQPNGVPVLNSEQCKIVSNKLECIECLSGNMANDCNGSLGMCFQKADGHYRCAARRDSSGVRRCVFEKDNENCFCQPDDPPSSPGSPETCNSDLNICSKDGEEICTKAGGQCTRTFNPIICSCGIQEFCQNTPDGLCGGDLHKCFSDPQGNDCVPSKTYWCGLSSEGKCTIERNPGKCEHCEDFCTPNNIFDSTCSGEVGKCSSTDCFCSLSNTGKCDPRFDPSKCSGGPEFCAGTPSNRCGEDIDQCLDFDNVCKSISVGGGNTACSIQSSPNLCPVATCVEGTCNSKNEICQCIDGRCSYIVSDDCKNCLGGTPFSINPCNGGVGKCFDGKECFVQYIGSGETSTQVCVMQETEECFCPAGAEDSNCFNNLDKCQNGKRCLIDPVTEKCDLQEGHDSFCCLEGTFDNNCNDFENTCIHTGRCSAPSILSISDKCEIKADTECYQSNFCKGSVSTECNGDLGKCSLEGNFGRCESDSNGNCILVADGACICQDIGNNCNGYIDKCIPTGGKCEKNSSGACVVNQDMQCCQQGTNSDQCYGNAFTCFKGTNFCVPVGTEGNCDIVQSDKCFCQGDESNNCNDDLNTCYDSKKCEIVTSGGNKVCRATSSTSCAEITLTFSPTTRPPTTKSKSLSPPVLIGIIIASSVVALVGGSYFIRRWYVSRTGLEETGGDSFVDE